MSPNEQRDALGVREAPVIEGSANQPNSAETPPQAPPISPGFDPYPPPAADSLAGCTKPVTTVGHALESHLSEPHAYPPAGHAQAPAGPAQAPAGHAQEPVGQAQAPVGQAQAPAGHAHAPAARVQSPYVSTPTAEGSPVAPDARVVPTPSNVAMTAPLQPATPQARRSNRLLGVVAGAALLLSMGAVGVIGAGVYHYRTLLSQSTTVAEDDEDSSTRRAGLPASDDDVDDADASSDPPSLDGLIKETTTTMRGNVEVVDVGVAAASLPDVLLAQRIVADTKQQTLVLMINGRGCEPCAGFDAALDDPKMQSAMTGVRLVRVDLEVFKDELRRMDLPTGLFPSFFLLSDDLRPRDAIHGGEWDEDVARNIAPVMAPFVRGELRERRHPEWAPTTTSIPL